MRHIRLPAVTLLIFLAIEFIDELVGGVSNAAWGLNVAMWLLLAGPAVLLLGLALQKSQLD